MPGRQISKLEGLFLKGVVVWLVFWFWGGFAVMGVCVGGSVVKMIGLNCRAGWMVL